MTIACTQPGCTGAIVDGYCDVCGSPAPAGVMGASATGSPVTGALGSPAAGSPSVTASVTASASPSSPAAGPGAAFRPPGTAAPAARPVPAGTTPAGAGAATGPDMSTASRVTGSARLASTPLGSARVAAGSRTARRSGTSSTRLRGARLGAGITRVPPLPAVDAATAVLDKAVVPEDRRFCASCGNPVGRSREGRPGREEGFCSRCGTAFSFAPKLTAGDVVGGQYEVAGCLAHGGLGWIYLARDRNVSDRWVVLKGLLNSGDPDALAAAIAERQFLAQVEHPLIVEIYNFVTHEGAGYIVMEYVGGTSLKAILKERMRRAGRYDPLPPDQAIAYLLEVLPAMQYLHDLGLLYCDFKPDNVLQVGDAVKLIDLGGVRRADDLDSAIYGTVGYQAPEVAEVGPSVASDVYTLGRTLAVLVTEFRGYQSTYVASLPPADDVPVFAEHDSLYRLLVKACAPDPSDRFASADELRVQLLGVLREVVAAQREREALAAGRPATAAAHSAASVLFEPPSLPHGAEAQDRLTWRELPALRVDDADPMAGWLATLSVADPRARLEALVGARASSPEVLLAVARAALDAGEPAMVETATSDLLAADPWEWRAVWMQGLAQLSAGDVAAARASFNAVYGQVPGELAPKLALAVACEAGDAADVAEALYGVCARTDANYVAPAAFGLARCRAARGDVAGAVAAHDLVPATNRAYPQARRARAQLLAASGGGLRALSEAMASVDGVALDPLDRARLTAGVLDAALAGVVGSGPSPGVSIGGVPATEDALRDGLEQAYRSQAALTADREERVRLVDAANAVRRWTRW